MLLSILSAIGSVLLIVLIVVLVLIALILFFPVTYRAKIEKHEKFQADGKVGWLFGVVKFVFAFRENKPEWRLKIFGITLKQSKEKKKNGKEDEPKYKPAKKQPTIKPGEKTELYRELKNKIDAQAAFKSEDYDYNDGNIRTFDDDDMFEEPSDPVFSKKVRSGMNKLSEIIGKVREMKAMLKRIWPSLSHLLKHAAPKRVKGYINFGFEDPSVTGYILGAVGMLCIPIPDILKINPDFKESEFECDVALSGRLFLIYVIIQAVRIIKDPDVRKLLGKKVPFFNKDNNKKKQT